MAYKSMGAAAIATCCPFTIYKRKYINSFISEKKSDSANDIFVKNNLLNIYQLHIYELLKLVLKSLSGLHRESYLNSLFSFSPSTPTRSASKTLLMEPS